MITYIGEDDSSVESSCQANRVVMVIVIAARVVVVAVIVHGARGSKSSLL